MHAKGDVDDTLGLQSAWLIYEEHVGAAGLYSQQSTEHFQINHRQSKFAGTVGRECRRYHFYL